MTLLVGSLIAAFPLLACAQPASTMPTTSTAATISTPATTSTSTTRSTPATTSAASGGVGRVGGVERIDLSAGFYLLAKPRGYRHGDRPPLVICLHETGTGARTILEFWRRLDSPIGMLLVAPEHHMPGWRETDLPCINAMSEHLGKHVTYDRRRVLLAGYSAGGAMAMHLLFAEGFAASAVAAMANYVPPSTTPQMVAARRDVPIFYAVGMRDINHDRMRDSIRLLQSNGGALELFRPNIGHHLDPHVGQRAMDWFVGMTTEQSLKRIEQAVESGRQGRYASGMSDVEPIVRQAKWHPPAVVARARPVLAELERAGLDMLAEADDLSRRGQHVAAIERFHAIETAYGESGIGDKARKRRAVLEGNPGIRSAQLAKQDEDLGKAAGQSLRWAQKLVARRRYRQAKEQCRRIMRMYPRSPEATRARTLLDQLNQAGK